MKKWLSIMVAAVLLFSTVAFAAVGSKTTSDLTTVAGITTADGTPVEGTPVTVASDSVMALDELDKIVTAVTTENKAPIDVFDADTQDAIADITGLTADELAKWEMNEFVSIGASADADAAGDLVVNMKVATPYEVGQKIVVVLGTFDGTRTETAPGEYEFNVKWTALEAEVVSGTANGAEIAVKFPADVLAEMKQSVSNVLAVLSEPKA